MLRVTGQSQSRDWALAGGGESMPGKDATKPVDARELSKATEAMIRSAKSQAARDASVQAKPGTDKQRI